MKRDESIKHRFEKFGKNIQKLREERKISLKELSTKTAIRKDYLQKIEKGIAYGLSIERHLVKIADALHVNIAILFKYE